MKKKNDRRMAARYVKTEYLDEYIEWTDAEDVEYIYIRILPEKIVSWDSSKDPVQDKFYRT